MALLHPWVREVYPIIHPWVREVYPIIHPWVWRIWPYIHPWVWWVWPYIHPVGMVGIHPSWYTSPIPPWVYLHPHTVRPCYTTPSHARLGVH